MTDAQASIIVAFIYFTTLCFICELAMALINTWMFLIKQRKYKTWPLLLFYVLTIWLALERIYSMFFLLFVKKNQDILGVLIPPILKLNIGAVQCWILFELGLRITQNIRLTEDLEKSKESC